MAKRNNLRTKEFVTIEELIWLFVGLAFGIFIGRGASFLLVALPVAAFVVWAVRYFERGSLY